MDYVDDSAYFDYAPHMSNRPHEKPDGNALLYIGTKMVMLSEYGGLTLDAAKDFNASVTLSYVEPGLLNRANKPGDTEAFDDYIGVVAGAHKVNPGIAFDIYKYGSTHAWVFSNIPHPTPMQWLAFNFWRFPSFVPHLKIAAGIKINMLEQILLSIDIVASALSPASETSGRILNWLKIKTFENKGYVILEGAKQFWLWQLGRKYPQKMGDVFGKYFSYEHPFSLFMINRS